MSETSLQTTHPVHDHPKLGRFLILSVIAHFLVVALLANGWLNSYRKVKPPVYYVDLVHKPVLNPQAGRPEPRAEDKPKATPVKSEAPKIVKPEPQPKPEPKPQPKPEPKPQPKPEPQPKTDKLAEQKRQTAIEELRQKQARQEEIDAIKQRLAKLQGAGAAAAIPKDVPVGMPDASGTEVGVSTLSHIQAYIQQNWALSPYLLDRSRLGTIEAKVLLVYSASGQLIRYRIIDSSGDRQFDDSIKKAITKSKQLEHKLPSSTELTVVFNLKEMADARR